MSWQLRTTEFVLRTGRRVSRGGSAELMAKRIEQAHAKQPRTAPPGRVARDLDVSSESIDGTTVYEVKPRGVSPRRHVVYLHGGSYTFEISPFHWRFIRGIANAVPARFAVPIYPLAPEQAAAKTVPEMADVAERIIDTDGAENVTLMGDSAGGGMALAVAELLRDRSKQPSRIVLISPWLDVTISEPQAREIEPRDAMLRIDGLRHCGLAYAGELDPKDPMVSPLFGELRGLAPVDVFIGTHDILYADIPPLQAALDEAGGSLTVHQAPRLPHVYPILPIPEAKPARATIAELVRA